MVNKKTASIIIGLIVVILVVGFLWFNNKPAPTNTPTNNQATTGKTYNVEISNKAFSQPSLTVKVGDTVVWTNKDTFQHTITSDTGTELNSRILKTDDTFSHTFNTAGTFNYHCEAHPSMKATVVVQ